MLSSAIPVKVESSLCHMLKNIFNQVLHVLTIILSVLLYRFTNKELLYRQYHNSLRTFRLRGSAKTEISPISGETCGHNL